MIHDFGKTGWIDTEGKYFPTDGMGYLHENIAQLLCDDYGWSYELVYGGTTAQIELLNRGFMRVDHVQIIGKMKPNTAQTETIRAMYQWHLDNPKESTFLYYNCYDDMQEILRWCDNDPTYDPIDLEYIEWRFSDRKKK